MSINRITITALAIITSLCSQAREWGDWQNWGEQPDGTYLNPVLPSDYSDLDCIRVGDDYYAMTSTFQFSPGMTIIHSRDLVNWEIVGNAVPDLTQISPALNYDVMDRYARGIWAGTLRHHDGKFYVYFGTPDEGYFMTSAPQPEGPWQPLTQLYDGPGWDDCTVMWDDESGLAYFVGTCFADNYSSYIYPMSSDGTKVDFTKGRLINKGNGREASKLIKHDGWYYLVFSEYKPNIGRYVMAKRTRSLAKPFAEEKILAHASVDAHEPNQGGIIQGADGKWYFFTHHGSGDWSGRIASLLPVEWIGGWPIIGEVCADGMGTMAWQAPMPKIDEQKLHIHRSDDFDESSLAPQWQWNYQPRDGWHSLTERPGWLRLHAFRPIEADSLLKAGNTLTARTFRSPINEVTIKIDVSGMADGQKAGLCHFSADNSGLGVAQDDGKRRIEFFHRGDKRQGPEINAKYVWIRSEWGLDGLSHYSYSTDGETFTPFGDYQLRWGNYKGDRFGIYCFNNLRDEGYVDVDYCHYRMDTALGSCKLGNATSPSKEIK